MGMRRLLVLGLISLASCATVFPYHFWRVDLEAGKAIADKPENDKDLKEMCAFSSGEYNCMVTTIDNYTNLTSDYKTKTERLIVLEKRCGGQ
jgi:hypothetical protein